MGLEIKNPSNLSLIESYSPTGDMILIVLCFLLLMILRQTFIKKSKIFYLFRTSIALLCLAAICNCLFYYVAVTCDYDIVLIVLREVYHVSLLFIFCLYISYMKILIGVPKKVSRIIDGLSYGLFCIFATADVLSPILGFSFYRDAQGVWIDHNYLKPFTIAYALYMLLLFVLLVTYHNRIPSKLLYVLFITEFVCVFLVFRENHYGHNSFLATTFLLPIFVILFMVHANSYSLKTGALNASSLDEYLSQQKGEHTASSYLCLYFDTSSGFIIPEELGKLFYNFWKGYFKKAVLFHPYANFFVLAVDNPDNETVHNVATHLIEEKFLHYFTEYQIPYKIISLEHLDFCNTLEELHDVFDYFASSLPVNSYAFYDSDDYADYQKIQYILGELKDISEHGSLDDERVLVYCQPVRNVLTNTYDTAESLMRLKLEKTGIVFPDHFIPLAEKYGYIHKLSMIILNKTCQAVNTLQQEGYLLSRVSVNLSISELSKPDFMEEFTSIVQSNHLPFETIAVELTESRNDTEYEIVLDRVNQFKSLGICTYLDDFGTGYSNFDRILSLKLDVVKFDRSLLLMAAKDSTARFILDYFSSAFEELGYKVLYEGVETDDQETLCIRSHADYLQGYKFSKPIPIEELRQFLSKK